MRLTVAFDGLVRRFNPLLIIEFTTEDYARIVGTFPLWDLSIHDISISFLSWAGRRDVTIVIEADVAQLRTHDVRANRSGFQSRVSGTQEESLLTVLQVL